MSVGGGGGTWGGPAPRIQKFTVAHTALQTAGATNTVVLYALAPREIVRNVTLKHSVAFGGGTIATYTLSVGIIGALVKYLAAQDVFQAVGDTVALATLQAAAKPESFANPTNIVLSAVAGVGLLNASTAGSVDVWLETVQLP